jgi:glutathione synthase/RimK-type ligase-like ATP-grasp enzyme
VDGQVFACKIDSQILDEDKGKVDWRQGYDHGLKHEPFELPEKIRDFCRAYLSKMNLHFGCFDMIVTPENEYVFLECNPNGQWLWIELATGMKISEAIAETLSRKELEK